MKLLYNASEAAEMLNVSKSTLSRMTRAGKIRRASGFGRNMYSVEEIYRVAGMTGGAGLAEENERLRAELERKNAAWAALSKMIGGQDDNKKSRCYCGGGGCNFDSVRR